MHSPWVWSFLRILVGAGLLSPEVINRSEAHYDYVIIIRIVVEGDAGEGSNGVKSFLTC